MFMNSQVGRGPRNGVLSHKRAALLGASLALMTMASVAQAQTAAPAGDVEGVVVSASRITTAGFDAPTPTTVLSADLIQKSAEPNMFTSITQLPSLQGSTGTTVANGNTSTGQTGLSALNMRGLGTFRSLTLIDGQRVVPGNVTGVTDISQFPQMLVQRVEIVTGGASASYGSDAVAGVVNFITDKRFAGFKANIQGGITTYGDDKRLNLQAAYGKSLLGGRAHLTLSGEYYTNFEGAPGALLSAVPLNGRPALDLSGSVSTAINQTPAGQPQFTYIRGFAQNITRGRNGLITSGPLQGIAFGVDGVPYTFKYGGSGIPNKTAAGGVVGCIGNICSGGETSNAGGGSSIDAEIVRKVVYGRFSYELTDNIELFATVNLADVDTVTAPTRGAPRPNLLAQCDNAFLHPSIPAACAAANITNFRYGTYGQNLNRDTHVNNSRQQRRFVVGANGGFDLAGKAWTYESYFQHGESITNVDITDITLTARYNAATDAIRLNGQIVCRSAVARASGCIPFNPFGDVKNSEAAFLWMAPANGPHSYAFQRQDAASFAINGTPFALPAGDVAIAAGVEWREEAYKTYGDPYGAGIASQPFTPDYPADPVLATAGDNWYAGNFHNGRGRYDVKEGFIEAGVPLWNNDAAGKADLNLAVRVTDYSTSGLVTTWKAGGTWDTPIEGVKIRGVRSRDIRAPSLNELFAAAINMNNFVINRANGASVQILNNAVGNPNLTPEISTTNEIGVVFRPSWAPGFSLSVDYFDISIKDAIQSISNQEIVDLCYNGNAEYCKNVFLGGTPGTNNPSYVIVAPFNLASVKTDGIDIEASYRLNLEDWNLPGELTLRGLVTKTFNFIENTGIAGQAITQRVGQNNGAIPYWKAYLQQSWKLDRLTLTATERMHADGVINRNYIVCTTGCPAPTVQNPTSNFNEIPGITYVDFGANFDMNDSIQFYAKVDNAFNKQPPSFGGTMYDTIGRRYGVGVRLKY
jgi:iron complex outermembrane receptor protein